MQSKDLTAAEAMQQNLTPKSLTAFMVGLKSPIQAFQLQRRINTYPQEPLLAILPGATLQELWGLTAVAQTALSVIAGFVVIAGLVGMLTTQLAGLAARRRELAILRSLGAGPGYLFTLLGLEALLLTTLGLLLGSIGLYLLQLVAAPLLQEQYGLQLAWSWPQLVEWQRLAAVWIAGLLAGLLPAFQAYRYSLSDGMALRV